MGGRGDEDTNGRIGVAERKAIAVGELLVAEALGERLLRESAMIAVGWRSRSLLQLINFQESRGVMEYKMQGHCTEQSEENLSLHAELMAEPEKT